MLRRVFLMGCALAAAFTTQAVADMKHVTGTVTYLERIALPPQARLQVALVDVSVQDAAAVEIATRSYDLHGVPADFRLSFESEAISERMTYAVQARITLEDRLMFTSTTQYPVLTNGAGDHVDMVLERVSDTAQSTTAQRPLAGTEWTATRIEGAAVTAKRPPTLAFLEGGKIAAFGGCNRFVGAGLGKDGGLDLSRALAGTLMACPQDILELESRYIDLLQQGTRYEVGNTTLVISDEAGTVLVEMRAGI